MQQDPLIGDRYFTLAGKGKSLYRDRGSKFYGFAAPLEGIAQAEEHRQWVKEQHPTARHHCFAYRLQPEKPLVRINDDGEPSHSAGAPIFQQIEAKALWNVQVVVVRYFGGTKLGIAGLAQAYKSAAKEALELAGKRPDFCYRYLRFFFPYAQMALAEQYLRQNGAEIVEQLMGEKAGYRLRCLRGEVEKLRLALSEIPGVKLILES